MNGRDLYNIAKSLMSEKGGSTVFDDFIINTINICLGDTFADNNMCRMFHDKKPLTEVPRIETLDDEVIYEDEYLHDVIPFGIAAQLETDDDLTKQGIYATKYANAKVIHQKVLSEDRVKRILAREE